MKVYIVKIEADNPPTIDEVERLFEKYYMGPYTKDKEIEVIDISKALILEDK